MARQRFTATDARQIFDAAAQRAAGNPDRVAKIELLREFCCDPVFRAAMRDEVARRVEVLP